MNERAVALLAEAVEAKPEDLPPDAAIGTYEPWDSLAHIRLFAALERDLGRPLTTEEAVSIHSLVTLAALLEEAGAPVRTGAVRGSF